MADARRIETSDQLRVLNTDDLRRRSSQALQIPPIGPFLMRASEAPVPSSRTPKIAVFIVRGRLAVAFISPQIRDDPF